MIIFELERFSAHLHNFAIYLSFGAPVYLYFFSQIKIVQPFDESFCFHIRVAVFCWVYGFLNIFTGFCVCLTGIIEFFSTNSAI